MIYAYVDRIVITSRDVNVPNRKDSKEGLQKFQSRTKM